MSGEMLLFEVGTAIDFRDSDWSKRAADKLMETLHRQKDPLLQRRIIATYLIKVASDAVRETIEAMVKD